MESATVIIQNYLKSVRYTTPQWNAVIEGLVNVENASVAKYPILRITIMASIVSAVIILVRISTEQFVVVCLMGNVGATNVNVNRTFKVMIVVVQLVLVPVYPRIIKSAMVMVSACAVFASATKNQDIKAKHARTVRLVANAENLKIV